MECSYGITKIGHHLPINKTKKLSTFLKCSYKKLRSNQYKCNEISYKTLILYIFLPYATIVNNFVSTKKLTCARIIVVMITSMKKMIVLLRKISD